MDLIPPKKKRTSAIFDPFMSTTAIASLRGRGKRPGSRDFTIENAAGFYGFKHVLTGG